MKKTVTLTLMLSLALAALPVASAGQGKVKGKGKQQKVEGNILLPAPFINDSGCYAGVHRRIALATMDNNNSVVGYHFDVDKATWNKPFVLEATGGQGYVDLDIYFYEQFGQLGNPEDPQANDVGPTAQFNTREAGGEADIVPRGMNRVIVCMYGGALGAGFGATFTYTAGKGVKLPK